MTARVQSASVQPGDARRIEQADAQDLVSVHESHRPRRRAGPRRGQADGCRQVKRLAEEGRARHGVKRRRGGRLTDDEDQRGGAVVAGAEARVAGVAGDEQMFADRQDHAEKLGVGYQRLQAENKIWVLSRLLIKIARYPRWAETVRVHTWPRAAKSVFAMRDFEMFDSSGERMLAGASAWLLLDTTTKKPLRVDKLVSEIQKSFPDRRALEQEPQKLDRCESNSASFDVTVRYTDIDVNGHVNNSRYIGWLMDAHSLELHRSHTVKSLEVNYLGETIAGDKISILTQEAVPGEYRHSMVKEDGTEVCRGRIEWSKL